MSLAAGGSEAGGVFEHTMRVARIAAISHNAMIPGFHWLFGRTEGL
jgi:hypothetical protein